MRFIAYFMPFMPEDENVVSGERKFLLFRYYISVLIAVWTGLHALLR